jgi:hypothetical protein
LAGFWTLSFTLAGILPLRCVARAGIDAGAPYNWRSIFRDVIEDTCHYTREIAELALGHSLGTVERAYRRETGVETRRLMMESYVDWLTRTGAGNGNVVELRKQAS